MELNVDYKSEVEYHKNNKIEKEKKLNRKQRRALDYARMQERQREKIRSESMPTGEPLLDWSLAQLVQACSGLTTLHWTFEEMCTKLKTYMELEVEAKQEMEQLGREEATNSKDLYEATLQGRVMALQKQRYERDLEDPIVVKTMEFLKTEEGLEINRAFGF